MLERLLVWDSGWSHHVTQPNETEKVKLKHAETSCHPRTGRNHATKVGKKLVSIIVHGAGDSKAIS